MNYILRLAEIIIISGAFLFSQCSYAQKEKPPRIQVKFEKNFPLKSSINSLVSEIEESAKSYQGNNKRAHLEYEGIKLFGKFLRSNGYYEHTINVEIKDNKNILIFHLNTGNVFTIGEIKITHAENSNKEIILPSINEIAIKEGQPARAAKINNSEYIIEKKIEENNCLLWISVKNQAILNKLDNKVDINFVVNAGENANIEKIDFTGLENIEEEYLHKLVSLRDGQCFRRSDIKKARRTLQKTGLFSSTSPSIPKKANNNGLVPIKFNLVQRKQKSISSGISYGTDLGLGLKLGWEHRNFNGNGENLVTNFFLNEKEQILEADYSKRFFQRDDQTLHLSGKAENRKTKVFNSKEISIGGHIERELGNSWTAGVGSRLSQSSVKDKDDSEEGFENFSLVSLPLFIKHYTKNDEINPTKGHEFKINAEPFISLNSKDPPFFKTKISGATYLPIKENFDPFNLEPVIALSAKIGSITGPRHTNIPSTEKFYVGGSNSLRGYAYQLVGKLDDNNHPLGGKSFLETSVELRLNLTEKIQFVTFLDSGFSYETQYPNIKERLLHGVGFGFRYITDFAPLRIDVGFPTRHRRSVDKGFHIYFGIGQAF